MNKLAVLCIAFTLLGCVTKKVFREELTTRDQRIASLETEIEANETRIVENEKNIEKLSESSQEALDRAAEAGKLARGKIVFEVMLTDDMCNFGVGQAELSPECRNELEKLSLELIRENRNVYIEVQGHTDATGDERYNEALGLRRAESVKRYLNEIGHIPLHRISTISYGETRPLSDNTSDGGRRLNRRVVIVVLE